jgi:hypothetical protein
MRSTVIHAILGLALAQHMLMMAVHGPIEWFAVTKRIAVIPIMEVKHWSHSDIFLFNNLFAIHAMLIDFKIDLNYILMTPK